MSKVWNNTPISLALKTKSFSEEWEERPTPMENTITFMRESGLSIKDQVWLNYVAATKESNSNFERKYSAMDLFREQELSHHTGAIFEDITNRHLYKSHDATMMTFYTPSPKKEVENILWRLNAHAVIPIFLDGDHWQLQCIYHAHIANSRFTPLKSDSEVYLRNFIEFINNLVID